MSQPSDRHLSQLEELVRAELSPPRDDLPLRTMPDRADRLLGVLDAMGAFSCEFDDKARLLHVSPNVASVLGFTAEECMARDCLEFHPDDLPQVIELGRTVRSSGNSGSNQARMRHKHGDWVWLETSLLGWYTDEGEFRTVSIARDITELKDAEATLRESETRYRVVSQMSYDLIVDVNIEGRSTYVGPGAEEILGYGREELLAFEPFVLVHPDDVERIKEQLAGQFLEGPRGSDEETRKSSSHELMEYRARHRDGRWLWFETLGRTYQRANGEMSYLAVMRDVTESKLAERERLELEQSLQRAQKLESLGVLAGGIAHDFNNLLTPILGAASLGLDELPEHSPTRARLEKIRQAAQRAAALTDQMLAYAGQQPLRIERLDLSKLVLEMQDLMATSISGKTPFDLELASDLPAVEGEAAQIGQLVMNLVTNASESLRDGTGRIRVRTGVVDVGATIPGALFAETMTPGLHVYFEIEDAGCGMDAEMRSRIFDPFYTTKFTGRGLGLAAVAGIVRAHRGAIEVESELGRGTRFRVLLPAAVGVEVEPRPRHTGIAAWRAKGTALVIDDDEAVRELCADVLSRSGMQVLTAADGLEGVKLFDEHAGSVRVVLLDRTMPTLSGADTFEAIRAVRPDARIVLVSGYSEERATSELKDRGLAGFLKKPFSPDALLERVRDVLEVEGAE